MMLQRKNYTLIALIVLRDTELSQGMSEPVGITRLALIISGLICVLTKNTFRHIRFWGVKIQSTYRKSLFQTLKTTSFLMNWVEIFSPLQ